MNHPDYMVSPPEWLIKICQYHRHDEGYEIAEDVWDGMIKNEVVPDPRCGWDTKLLCICADGTGQVYECPAST